MAFGRPLTAAILSRGKVGGCSRLLASIAPLAVAASTAAATPPAPLGPVATFGTAWSISAAVLIAAAAVSMSVVGGVASIVVSGIAIGGALIAGLF